MLPDLLSGWRRRRASRLDGLARSVSKRAVPDGGAHDRASSSRSTTTPGFYRTLSHAVASRGAAPGGRAATPFGRRPTRRRGGHGTSHHQDLAVAEESRDAILEAPALIFPTRKIRPGEPLRRGDIQVAVMNEVVSSPVQSDQRQAGQGSSNFCRYHTVFKEEIGESPASCFLCL